MLFRSRTPSNATIFAGLNTGWSFDRLPLLIHDPTHQLPPKVDVLSGSLDVAPTLLHLVGLAQQPTTMAGASIFGNRQFEIATGSLDGTNDGAS